MSIISKTRSDENHQVRRSLPASSSLSPLTLEASNALLPPLRSHGQQLGGLGKDNMLASHDIFRRVENIEPFALKQSDTAIGRRGP